MATVQQQQRIQDYFEDPYHRGRCDHPTHYSEASNTACGDIVAAELRVLDERIEEAWFDGEGCQLSQAVASMIIERIEGSSAEDVANLSLDAMLTMLDLNVDSDERDCCQVGLSAIQQAIDSPIDENPEGPTFAGPDLGDEC